MAGHYANTEFTTYGTATFWKMTDLHYALNPGSSAATFVYMAGFTTEADYTAGAQPIGYYGFNLGGTDMADMLAGTEGFLANVVIASDAAWANAVYTP